MSLLLFFKGASVVSGTTLAQMQAGSTVGKWVAALGGYQYLLTDATAAQAIAAWSGTDYVSALDGLTVDFKHQRRLDPWEPFTGAGRMILHIQPDANDTFGIDCFRVTAGAETLLDDTVDNNDTTLPAAATTAFDSSGTVYVGTEAIVYASKDSDSFNSCTRGYWSPFGINGGTRFGQWHRKRIDPNGVNVPSQISAQPRRFDGRWVGLWRHKYDHEAGLLNSKDDAQLVFAGKVKEVRDPPESNVTLLECEHVLDTVANATLGAEQWTAKIKEGIELQAYNATSNPQWLFSFRDRDASYLTANPLTVVSGTPASVNEIKAGTYSLEELISKINDWLSAEKDAGRLNGIHYLNVSNDLNNEPRTWIGSIINMTGDNARFEFKMPPSVNEFLGSFTITSWENDGRPKIIWAWDDAYDNTLHLVASSKIPLRNIIFYQDGLEVEDERGVFGAQTSNQFPPEVVQNSPDANGVFVVDGKIMLLAYKDGSSLTRIYPMGDLTESIFGDSNAAKIPFNDPRPAIEIKQVYLVATNVKTLIKTLFASTGTSGYNHASYDAFPKAIGLGIPWGLLGSTFETSVDNLPQADQPILFQLDRPTKLRDLLAGDLLLRWAFLRWKDECLQFATWTTPTTGSALTESNKAAPVGDREEHRSATRTTDEWQRTTIKINYDRYQAIGIGPATEYRNSITFVDPAGADIAGGDDKVHTVNAPNVATGFFLGSESSLEALKLSFKSIMPMFSRPTTLLTRSIDSRFFEGFAEGDSVLLTDEYARDPDTGARGISARPALIVAHSWSLGGPLPDGTVQPPFGEVELLLRPHSRIAKYAPCAQVDDTASNSGYNAGTFTLTCYAHKHSESSESADASYFPSGSKVLIVEIDPATASAPDKWARTVDTQSGNTITLTSGLSSPAWDTTKKYRVISDFYGEATSTFQSTYAYQADDADALIDNTRAPFEYIAPAITGSYTANAASDPVELIPELAYTDAVAGDGPGRDVGHEAAISRLINNLLDYKTTHSRPFIQQTQMTGSAFATNYTLMAMYRVNLTREITSASCFRRLIIAPLMRSTDGTTANVRVTITKNPPIDAADLYDVSRGFSYAEAVFTTTSTTYAVATTQEIAFGPQKSVPYGNVWVLIECSAKAQTYGLAVFQEGARTDT